ncbi:MAG: GTPase HflX [Peptostreptococcaceae bacterium]|nr:GTPase HflX [Peptostreptococcaceae bacterium]
MKTIETNNTIQYRAILVTLAITEKSNKEYIDDIDPSVDEFKELAKATDIEVLGNIIQNKDSVDVTYFVGKGKVEEIKEYAQNMDANLIIFNHELSGSQIRNLENEIGIDVIDRTMLILEIFAKRAVTKEGKLQVELAQLKYRLPRLSGLGEKLSRLGGGIGTRGPGEKKLETDKRHIQSRINEIERELKDTIRNRAVQRSKRIKSGLPIVALVGYTNVGKSTIVNEIIKRSPDHGSEREVFVKDMLFATLGTHLRRAYLNNGNEFLLTDTIGFVSRLPHSLIKAFRSTLEEIRYADLIIHVLDASDPNYDLLRSTTERVLTELNIPNIPVLIVNNKMDKVSDTFVNVEPLQNTINISAKKEEDILKLISKIEHFLLASYKEVVLFFPYERSDLLSDLHKKYNDIKTDYENDGIKVSLKISDEDKSKYRLYILS